MLVSGSGSNLQALLDACADPAYGAQVVAVGADREGVAGLDRAADAGVPSFVHKVKDYAERTDWDRALTASVAEYKPDLVVSAGLPEAGRRRNSWPRSAIGTSTRTTRCCRPSPGSTGRGTRSSTA